jgi:hypothetical protein
MNFTSVAMGGRAPPQKADAEMLEDPLSAYRTFGMPTYAAEAERLQRKAGLMGPKTPSAERPVTVCKAAALSQEAASRSSR